jgi:NDP-sugar pyrophosphorylase family protein
MFFISMAGEGNRFKKLGFTQPKYELKAKEKTLFEWSVGSFAEYFERETFVFIYREGNSSEFITQKCLALGIKNYVMVPVNRLTSGQAETVLIGLDTLNTNESFFIFNIDTCLKMKPADYPTPIDLNCDGWLQTFKAPGDHWSFARVNGENRVTEVAEKRRISDLASTGLYYFKDPVQYRELYARYGSQIIQDSGELYVAPLLNYLLKSGGFVQHSTIEFSQVIPLGTPEEVKIFDSSFASYNG